MEMRPRGPSARAWVKEFSNKTSTWEQIVSEWLDNSIGHGATRIDVAWSPRLIEVRDNGVGCTRKMFAALISPNSHEEDETVENRVSIFGIGAKIGFLWCQGLTQCYSRRREECYSTKLEWQDVEEWNDFDSAYEGLEATKHCEAVGLRESGVLIRQEHNRRMDTRIFNDVHRALGKRYWAAIETGVEIDVRFTPHGTKKKQHGGLLPGRKLPEFASELTISEEVRLADGRRIQLDGGVLANAVRLADPGFEYIYGHRVVLPAGGVGSGGMDFERIYCRVYLLGNKEDWRVTTTKDHLHDADLAALEQAVFDRCKPLLEQAAQSDYAQLLEQELLNEVADALNEADRKRATRGPRGNATGTHPATGEGSEHQTTTRPGKPRGKYRSRANTGQITVKVTEFEDERVHLIGKAVVADKLVRLNKRHPHVEQRLAGRDKGRIYDMVFALWSHAWTNTDDNGQKRTVPRSDFVSKYSAMLSLDQELEPAK